MTAAATGTGTTTATTAAPRRKPRATLAGGLARTIALSAAICLVVVSAISAATWWALESDESPADIIAEGPTGELTEVMVVAIAIASSLGIATMVFAVRWLTRRATARIDGVIDTAARINAQDLTARLPVSPIGDELDALAVEVNKMLARLDVGIAGQRQFASDASHELRTPVAVARMKLEVARLRARTVREWELTADEALAQLEKMSTLIDALLQLARADVAGPTREPIDLADVIDRVHRVMGVRASARRVELAVDAPAELGVIGDPDALEIALGNLVANAIAHSPDGATVAIGARRAGDRVRVEVTDHGPGVPDADRERILEPFTRGNAIAADRAVAGAGVGLGLAIAKRIALAHGGGLEVDDAPGGGGRFALLIPAAAPVAAVATVAARARG